MEEDHESVQSLDVKSTHVDSMATQRLFTFDELDYWLFKPDSSWLITDSASVSSHTVHVKVKGGRLETKTKTKTKTEADLKSVESDKTHSYSEKKQVQYTYINWFIAGIMVLLSIILIIRIRWPTRNLP